MTALERITQLRSQGMPENEIIRTLQSEGVTPKEITDALSQSQIKKAVSNMDEETSNMQPSMMGGKLSETQGENAPPPTSEYTPPTAISDNPPAPSPNQAPAPTQSSYEEEYTPQSPYAPPPQNTAPQEQYSQQQYYPQEPSTGGEEYYPQEQEYDQYGGNYQEGYGYETSSNTDTIIEVAEQVFTEKMKKFHDQMDDLIEFKTLFETKVENIAERLKRIEKMFDQMQISVIEKVGAYGRGIENLKKEIEMVEDSFSKISGKIKKSSTPKKTSSKKSKK